MRSLDILVFRLLGVLLEEFTDLRSLLLDPPQVDLDTNRSADPDVEISQRLAPGRRDHVDRRLASAVLGQRRCSPFRS